MNLIESVVYRFPFAFLVVLATLWGPGFLCAQVYSKQDFARDYRDYLAAEFPAEFIEISVGNESVDLRIKIRRAAQYKVQDLAIAVLPAHVPSHRDVATGFVLAVPVTRKKSEFVASVPRVLANGIDRSLRRFVLVHQVEGKELVRLSASAYPSTWREGTQRELERQVGKDRKGLGGIPNDSAKADHQIYDLGISHATVNIVLNSLVRLESKAGFRKINFEGQDVFVNEQRLRQYDQRLSRLRAKGIVASLILLVGNRRDTIKGERDLLIHPEASVEGKFAMPNLATAKGSFLYRAIIYHLAERFSREGPVAGRISNWILHNEVDQSGVWTNMGAQPLERYLETYVRSARIVHHSARRFNPHARVFISLTHHWMKISGGKNVFRVRDIVDKFAEAARVEGDFEWGVAYHPYPRNLREPRVWNDEDVTLGFDTPYITPRNIEVLPAYLKQKRLRYLGKHERAILLSEQGCNARSLSEKDQEIQAAGIVYTFFRIRHLPTVEAFHYHAYRDSPDVEGGLRLGLVDENEVPKTAWKVYQSLNTRDEGKITNFAWSIMGPDARRHANSAAKIKSRN